MGNRIYIPIATYNVLSDVYAEKSLVNISNQDVINFDKRLDLFKIKFLNLMKGNYVICLQEVTKKFGDEIISFFFSNSYNCVYDNYSGEYNGYMGVLIAYPNFYKISNIVRKKISDDIPEDEDEVWTIAKKKSNVSIGITLEYKRMKFCLVTYHMPCIFGDNSNLPVMTIHLFALIRFAYEYTNDLPLILAGDFNFDPTKSLYNLVTTGYMNTNDSYFPKKFVKDFDLKIKKMRSAYKVKLKKEPEFTTCAKKKSEKFVFKECIDFIWISDHWRVNKVIFNEIHNSKNYYKDKDNKLILPSLCEPSDHFCIGATLFI
tara:strand:- start:675 stop:1625 length:951 start_codon:yes stop_codon:yes gene_type:complete